MTERENTVELALSQIKDEEQDELLKVRNLVKRIKYGELALERDKQLLDDYIAGKDVKL